MRHDSSLVEWVLSSIKELRVTAKECVPLLNPGSYRTIILIVSHTFSGRSIHVWLYPRIIYLCLTDIPSLIFWLFNWQMMHSYNIQDILSTRDHCERGDINSLYPAQSHISASPRDAPHQAQRLLWKSRRQKWVNLRDQGHHSKSHRVNWPGSMGLRETEPPTRKHKGAGPWYPDIRSRCATWSPCVSSNSWSKGSLWLCCLPLDPLTYLVCLVGPQ